MAYKNPIPILDDEAKKKEQTSISENDYSKMGQVYFALIDVLGFKKTFDDMKISKGLASAEKYKKVFNYYFELMNAAKFMDPMKETGCYAGQTSDTLYFYTSRTDYLMQFIKLFCHFTLYAMSQNVFFRGGIAKGELFRKKKYQFYGDSVIGAYLLESSVSKNPKIIVDEQTHHDMLNEKEYSNFIINSDRHYIKPFFYFGKKAILDVCEGFRLEPINEKSVEQNIKDNKTAFEYDADNYAKYSFLLNELEMAKKNRGI